MMAEHTVSIEIEDAGFDVDDLERLGIVIERDAGHLGPSCALHGSALSVRVTVDADSRAEAVRVASEAIAAAVETVEGGTNDG